MVFGYYSRNNKHQEIINRTVALSRLQAAKSFSERKQLPLKSFLKIYAVKPLI
jgi:hypothetical protein